MNREMCWCLIPWSRFIEVSKKRRMLCLFVVGLLLVVVGLCAGYFCGNPTRRKRELVFGFGVWGLGFDVWGEKNAFPHQKGVACLLASYVTLQTLGFISFRFSFTVPFI